MTSPRENDDRSHGHNPQRVVHENFYSDTTSGRPSLKFHAAVMNSIPRRNFCRFSISRRPNRADLASHGCFRSDNSQITLRSRASNSIDISDSNRCCVVASLRAGRENSCSLCTRNAPQKRGKSNARSCRAMHVCAVLCSAGFARPSGQSRPRKNLLPGSAARCERPPTKFPANVIRQRNRCSPSSTRSRRNGASDFTRLPSPAAERAIPPQSKPKSNWSFDRRRLRSIRLERSACRTSCRFPLRHLAYRRTSTSFGPLPCCRMVGPSLSGELQLAAPPAWNAWVRREGPAFRPVTGRGAGDGKLQNLTSQSESNRSVSHFSSGAGPGIHQPGSMTWGDRTSAMPAPSGRARDRAMCPAGARSIQRRIV